MRTEQSSPLKKLFSGLLFPRVKPGRHHAHHRRGELRSPALDCNIVPPGSVRVFSYADGFVNRLPDFGRTQFAPTETPQNFLRYFVLQNGRGKPLPCGNPWCAADPHRRRDLHKPGVFHHAHHRRGELRSPALDRNIVQSGSVRIFPYANVFVNKLPDFGRTQFAPTETPQNIIRYFVLQNGRGKPPPLRESVVCCGTARRRDLNKSGVYHHAHHRRGELRSPALACNIVPPGSVKIFSYADGFVNRLSDFGRTQCLE